MLLADVSFLSKLLDALPQDVILVQCFSSRPDKHFGAYLVFVNTKTGLITATQIELKTPLEQHYMGTCFITGFYLKLRYLHS